MIASLALWGVGTILLGVLLWFCRPRVSALLIWVIGSAILLPASMMPLGEPAFMRPPPGKHTVLGARIDVDEAIYVLLDSGLGGPPRYYVLPYSTGQANALQGAIDAAQGEQGGVEAEMGEDGGEMAFHGPAVQEDRPKQPERPAYEVQ